MKKLIVSTIILFILTLTAAYAGWGVQWNPNPENNIAGYRVYYGNESGKYTETIDVGNVTEADMSQLPAGDYFFVVTAYNTLGLESLPSDELNVTVLGRVTNLRLKIAGNSLSVTE